MPASLPQPQAGDALWLVSAFAVLKGLSMFAKIVPILRKVLGLLTLLIVLAEDAIGPGNGADKKAAVIKDFKDWFTTTLAADFSVPSWLVGMLTSDALLGVVIDYLVAGFNKFNSLKAAVPAPAEKPVFGPPVS